MGPCIVAALLLLVAAFIAPGAVGEMLVIAAVVVFVIGLVLGGISTRNKS